MVQQEFCQICPQKDDCRKVYRKLGNTKGPPVTAKVVLAFLLPLLIFIVSLGTSERILTKVIDTDYVLTAISLLLSLLVTFACIVLIRILRRESRQGG
jgi:DMSO/TMAO reductase YedYZ heme-binding membrane subunit